MKYKKVVPILLAVILGFASVFAIPQKKAEAVAFGAAVPAGITLGAGAYTVGALGVAGIVGIVGYEEYEDEINAHAMRAWENGTQLSKDSMNAMIEGAKGAGNALVGARDDLLNWTHSLIPEVVDNINHVSTMETVVKENYNLGLSESRVLVTFTNGYTVKNHDGIERNYMDFLIGKSTADANGKSFLISNYGHNATTLKAKISSISSAQELSALITSFGGTAMVLNPSFDTPATTQRVTEAWEGMRDAGLVLPVDSAVPLNSIDGTPLTYNPDADTYAGIDGGLYEGTPAWAFPQPKLRTGTADVPAGVYVDTPVLTGNPTYDDAIVANPDIPMTTTNIQTGVTVGNPDFATSTPIETPAPGGGVPPGSDWTKPPTKKPPNISGLVITKFPFSLPWDFFDILGWLNAEPKAPSFKLDSEMKNPFGANMQFDMELNLSALDDYIGYFRSFILIGFSLFLILATRKLMGGGS